MIDPIEQIATGVANEMARQHSSMILAWKNISEQGRASLIATAKSVWAANVERLKKPYLSAAPSAYLRGFYDALDAAMKPYSAGRVRRGITLHEAVRMLDTESDWQHIEIRQKDGGCMRWSRDTIMQNLIQLRLNDLVGTGWSVSDNKEFEGDEC